MKKLVVPGEVISETPLRLYDTIIDNNKTCTTVMGIYDDETKALIPLEGLWYPRDGESIIGIVEEARLNSYSINLNAPYKGVIIAKFLKEELTAGDIIEASVKELDKTGTVVLTRPRTLFGGKLIGIKPSKIPRVLGKNNTMIKQLSTGTQSTIVVGMNGLLWIKGGDTDLATELISKIQAEAHTSGLTGRINEILNIKGDQGQQNSQQQNE